MTDTVLDGLRPLQPGDPQEVQRVSAEVISAHIDEECGATGGSNVEADRGSMADVAGLEDCQEPWTTTDHVGNHFTVTICGTPDNQVVSLYEYDRSEHAGMAREYVDTTHVTPTWAVAASTEALLRQVVGKLEDAGWPPSGGITSQGGKSSSQQRSGSVAPDSGAVDWDVVEGDYYATVTDCPLDDDGDPFVTVMVRNGSSKEADILGIVEIIDTTTDELHSFALYQAWNVAPGETVETQTVGFEGVPDRYVCAAYTVGAVD